MLCPAPSRPRTLREPRYTTSTDTTLVVGQILGGAIAQHWGVVAPFWFAFIGSGLTLIAVWRQIGVIAHAGS